MGKDTKQEIKEDVRFMPTWNEVLTKPPEEAYRRVREEVARLQRLHSQKDISATNKKQLVKPKVYRYLPLHELDPSGNAFKKGF